MLFTGRTPTQEISRNKWPGKIAATCLALYGLTAEIIGGLYSASVLVNMLKVEIDKFG